MYYDTYFVEGCEDREVSRLFLRTILAYSDAFSLIYFKHCQDEKASPGTVLLKKELSKFKLDSRLVTEWPGTRIQNEQKHIYRMNTYRTDIDIMPIFERVETLWDWDYPDYPMDPCFYKDGYAWFTVTTHEHWNQLYMNHSGRFPLVSDLESLGVTLLPGKKVDESKLFHLPQKSMK